MTFDPDYSPFGRADKTNPYFKKINHTKQAKTIRNASTFLGTPPETVVSGSLTVGQNGAATFAGFFLSGGWGAISPATIEGQTINILRATVANDLFVFGTNEATDFTSDTFVTINILGADRLMEWSVGVSQYTNTFAGIGAALQAQLGNVLPITITYNAA